MKGEIKLEFFTGYVLLVMSAFLVQACPSVNSNEKNAAADLTKLVITSGTVDYTIAISGTKGSMFVPIGTRGTATYTIKEIEHSSLATANKKAGDAVTLDANYQFSIIVTSQNSTLKVTYLITVEEGAATACPQTTTINTERGACGQTLALSNSYSMQISGGNRIISANNIPAHKVGLFGNVPGSLNPNTIRSQTSTYTITTTPAMVPSLTPLLSTTSGPAYSFGVLLNGVELDPIAAEPFPHKGIMAAGVNWNWNWEATNVRIGLDCNNAHVQPSGKYHYHGTPTLYVEGLHVTATSMTLIGYAADGFPIYHKYGYTNASDATSAVKELKSSYRLKSGNRPGDGITAPCGEYTGVYSSDYEYVEGIGDLDAANGRTGVTPEFPKGTYYYVITTDFPQIPRYFKGTPSTSFKIGG